jgi:signal transduction histidine kinase
MVKSDASNQTLGQLILTREYAEVLHRHGLSWQLRLSDEHGNSPAGPALAALVSDLRAAQQRSEHARRLVQTGTLAASVTHEIRNLLTGALGFAQLLRTKSYDAERVKDTAQLIEAELRRCVDVIATFLKHSRSGMEATRELAVDEVLLAVERLTAHSLRQRACTLQIEIGDDVPKVLGRSSDLQRIFLNLVLNAADAAHTSGTRIMLSAQRGADGNVELRVSDDGPGVPTAIAERIFEAFFSTKPAGEGTGIGLSISRNIAEAHGGQLLLESKLTPGATFLLRLPPIGKRLDGRAITGGPGVRT